MGKSEQAIQEKTQRKIRRLYLLIWFLACPLLFILCRLLRFEEITIVYATLLVVPVLYFLLNYRSVPKLRKPQPALYDEDGNPKEQPEPEGVSRKEYNKALFRALKMPLLIAFPIVVTLIVNLFVE